ncbi:MAG: hypothetical protein ACRCWR_03520 [Saezia sp.]
MNIKPLLLSILLLCSIHAGAQTKPSTEQCKNDALVQAQKLLVFHFGSEDDRIEINPDVELLPSIANPANKSQRFDVLEVWGNIYKGQYRMRLIYYPMSPNDCVLMGQEILELANL